MVAADRATVRNHRTACVDGDGLEAKLYQPKKKEAGCGRWHLLEVPLELLRGPLVEKEAGSAEEGSVRAKCVATVPLARRAHAAKARLAHGA